MSRFEFTFSPMTGLHVIKRQVIRDSRGYLSRFFCAEELKQIGWGDGIAQINHTFTNKQGAIRGMHFQLAPFAEKKMISCIRGRVCDVAVDLRSSSATFLKWYAQELSAENQVSILIPEGFAHGFQVLSEEGAELIYLHSKAHAPGYEGAVSAFDPSIGIAWPMPVTEISERDKNHPLIGPNFVGVPSL